MAESFSREKLRQAPQKEGGWKNPVLPSSCVTPAGTSIEVQNEWEKNKHTQTHIAKFGFTVDEGKEWLNPSREKNKGTHRRKKVDEKSCVTFLLCDPGWYVQRT